MKKAAGILLSLFIILFSQISNSYAQENATSGSILDITPAPQETQYTFAYPGILPDNPLYFLKAARDRIISFLINDPVKKAEFNLLTSDKRVYASELLLAKNKEDIALTTLSKSNNYLHEVLVNANEAKGMGKNADAVISNLKNAIKKREEVFFSMREKISEDFKVSLESEIKRLAEFKKSANEFSSK